MKKFDYHQYVSMTVIIVALLIITFFVFGPNANFFQGFDTPIDCDNIPDATNAVTFYKNADTDNDGLSDLIIGTYSGEVIAYQGVSK